MKLLDRYILRQFLLNFLILLVVVMTKIVLVDTMFNLDEFIEAGRAKAKAEGGITFLHTLVVMADYYGPQVCFLYVYIGGLIAVAAMGFTLTQLSRGGELVTMISSGISLHRVAAPLLVAACVINAMTIVDQELVVPGLIDKLTRKSTELKSARRRAFAVQYAPDSKGNLISAAEFDPQTRQMLSVSILERDGKGKATRRITATQATWDDTAGQWLLSDGNAIRRTEQAGSMPADTRVEAATFFETDVSPHVLMARRAAIYPALLSMGELGRLMNNPAADARVILRIMHSRFSLMVFNVLILVMVLPMFLTREPINPMKKATLASGVAIGLWVTGIGMLQLGSGLNPVVAAWLPVIIFLPVSAAVLLRTKT
jgi:lipopolysaccharide export LptBFGC system permease protein LptF